MFPSQIVRLCSLRMFSRAQTTSFAAFALPTSPCPSADALPQSAASCFSDTGTSTKVRPSPTSAFFAERLRYACRHTDDEHGLCQHVCGVVAVDHRQARHNRCAGELANNPAVIACSHCTGQQFQRHKCICTTRTAEDCRWPELCQNAASVPTDHD